MWLEYFEQYLKNVFPRFLEEKPWNYKDDLCIIGANDLYHATGDERSHHVICFSLSLSS